MNLELEKESYQLGWLGVIKAQVESLKFGTVQIVVHESRVVQVEKTEKWFREGRIGLLRPRLPALLIAFEPLTRIRCTQLFAA